MVTCGEMQVPSSHRNRRCWPFAFPGQGHYTQRCTVRSGQTTYRRETLEYPGRPKGAEQKTILLSSGCLAGRDPASAVWGDGQEWQWTWRCGGVGVAFERNEHGVDQRSVCCPLRRQARPGSQSESRSQYRPFSPPDPSESSVSSMVRLCHSLTNTLLLVGTDMGYADIGMHGRSPCRGADRTPGPGVSCLAILLLYAQYLQKEVHKP